MKDRINAIDIIIDKTQTLVEKYLKIELSNSIITELYNLLDKDYWATNKNDDVLVFNSGCWGGGVWDKLYNSESTNSFKSVLVINYEETQNGLISPVLAEFPHKELDAVCMFYLLQLNSISKAE